MISFSLSDKNYVLDDNDIETIFLFGSFARGDFDLLSDLDLFIVIDDCDELTMIRKKKKILSKLEMPLDWISLYRKSSVKTMVSYGSYFLWHLKTEGSLLYSRNGFIEKCLEVLPRYKNTKDDLLDYLAICNDIKESIVKDSLTISYELSILSSLVRNTCIALAYLHGKMVFGRISPIQICKDILGSEILFTVDEYNELYKFRLAFTRGNYKNINLQKPTSLLVEKWLKYVRKLIEITLRMEERINER